MSSALFLRPRPSKPQAALRHPPRSITEVSLSIRPSRGSCSFAFPPESLAGRARIMSGSVSDEARPIDRGIATSAPASPQDNRRSRRHVDRSCTVCHRRKVRCDKRLPCAACVRGKHECKYDDGAGDERPKRRRPRQTIADVASRISSLEKSMVHVSSPSTNRTIRRTSGSRDADRAENTPLTSHTTDTRDSNTTNEVLIQNGSTSQYVNESVISRMIEAVGFIVSSGRDCCTHSFV